MLIQSSANLTKFRHADAAKLKATLEGVEKGHAIAMDGLNQQLRKSLAENATLEGQLKDLGNQGKKKDLSKIKCFHCHEYGHYATKCLHNKFGKMPTGGARGYALTSHFKLDFTLIKCMESIVRGSV